MKIYIYLLLVIICTLTLGCSKINDSIEQENENNEIVEVLEDGSLRVKLSLQSKGMGNMSVSSRAIDNSTLENTVYDGWCLVFGEDDTEDANTTTAVYTDNSPLIQKIPFVANANGDLFIVLKEYEKTAIIRIIANLTKREEDRLIASKAWFDNDVATDINKEIYSRPTNQQVKDYNIATFNVYKHESVGLDGIYNITYNAEPKSGEVDEHGNLLYLDPNTNKPNSNKPSPSAVSLEIPMSSVGFMMDKINAETIKDKFGSIIYMVRTCSKVDVTVMDAEFKLSEIYMIECAQESFIRSPVIGNTNINGEEAETELKNLPKDLGSPIDYEPLVENVASGETSTPIYFYPNAGGDYKLNDNMVNHNINPQYIIIKGRAGGYDTDGYYKIALKAQYPLAEDSDESNKNDRSKWSALTYDILRNTHFNVRLIGVNKPGYKTLEDAKNPNNPANNISYNITINGENSNNEFLVSNGTYFVELSGSRVYVKGYSNSGVTDCKVKFIINPNENNFTPQTYISTSGGVTITEVISNSAVIEKDNNTESYKLTPQQNKIETEITFSANSSGRIRLRIGDILKYIPVRVEDALVSAGNGSLTFLNEPDSKFDYSDIFSEMPSQSSYDKDYVASILTSDGIVTKNPKNSIRELRAKLYTNSGITKLYFKQHAYDSDAKVEGEGGNVIILDDLIGGSPADKESREDLENKVVEALVDNSHSMVYIEGEFKNDLFSDNGTMTPDNILNDIYKNIADKVQNGALPSDYTYSLDLSGMKRAEGENEDWYGKPFTNLNICYFKGNEYIKSLVLPSFNAQFDQYIFNGCKNLTSVTIGSESDLSNTLVQWHTFYGMKQGAIVTLYNKNVLQIPGDIVTDINNKDMHTLATYEMHSITDPDGSTIGYKYVFTII